MATCSPSHQQPYHDQPAQTMFTPGPSLSINQQPLTMCASNNTFSHQPSYTALTGHELDIVNETAKCQNKNLLTKKTLKPRDDVPLFLCCESGKDFRTRCNLTIHFEGFKDATDEFWNDDEIVS